MPTREELAGLSFKERLDRVFTPLLRFFFAGMFLIIGFALTVGSSAESRETRLLEDEGVTTTAEVLSVRQIARRTQILSISERVRFTTAEGEVFEETITDCASREPEQVGSMVEVRYAPSDPTAVQFADLECRKVSDATQFVVVGVIVLVVGLLVLWSAIRAWRRKRKAATPQVSPGESAAS